MASSRVPQYRYFYNVWIYGAIISAWALWGFVTLIFDFLFTRRVLAYYFHLSQIKEKNCLHFSISAILCIIVRRNSDKF